MSKVLIIGCGGVASVAIHKCCQVPHTASLFNSDFRLFQFRFNGLRTRKRCLLCFPLFF